MNNDFMITRIERIIFVDEKEYLEDVTAFTGNVDFQQFIYNFSGENEVYFDDAVLYDVPESIRYLPKCKIKKYVVKRKVRGACIDIFFESNKPFSETAFVKKFANNKQLAQLFKKAFTSWITHTENGRLEATACIYRILSILNNETYIPEEKYKIIKPATQYINENFLTKQITNTELSEICNISERYLNQLFSKYYKLPPQKYINHLKLNLACDLLMEHTYTITQIAASTGFENVHYFSRAFKEHIGLTPTEFRKKYVSCK